MAWMRAVASVANFLMKLFVVGPHDCAEYMWHGLLTNDDSALRFDNHGKNWKGSYYHGTEEANTKLWGQ